MIVISASAPLLTPVTTGPEYQREVSKIAAMMSNVSNTSDEMDSSKNPSQLSELATKKLISRLTPRDCSWTTDVIETSNFIKNFSFPKNVFKTLTKETLKQLKFDNNPKIVFDVASARVKNGESCTVVGQEHGIATCDKAFHELQMLAVKGPAGERVSNGESCTVVGQEHGIPIYDKAFHELQMLAVKGPAGERVSNGESCTVVGQEHGIATCDKAFHELQMLADAANNKRQLNSQSA
ncbi:hypothetical protein [Pantoea agglomerans]|uniref:hypothetical protein n=1 Tax=Enterobacter agglomerans TaxID=549 RepID=UPI001F5B0C3C|nr:hypothetical protein [Pantoea agglomerans]